MLTIAFTTSPSHLFPVALDIAGRADEFTNQKIGKVKQYKATFGATAAQAELAVALLQHLDNLKGVLVYVGARLAVNQDAVIATLGCFIASQAVSETSQYCHRAIVIETAQERQRREFEVNPAEPPRYSFPCAKLLQSGFQPEVKGAKVAAQILAGAAHAGCDWCPNFKASDWRKIK